MVQKHAVYKMWSWLLSFDKKQARVELLFHLIKSLSKITEKAF